MTLNDAILAATGGPTVNDGLMSYYGGVGALRDRERAWLLANGGVSGTNQDLWMQALLGAGYTGTLNDMQFSFWSGGGVITNLYPNPTLIGGSDIVADVFLTMPDNHVATIFAANPCDATYLGPGNPAYTFVGTGNSRFAIACNVNTATNRGVTLPGGREYRFSAIVQSIGEAAVETRLVNAASPTSGAVVTDGPLILPDGTPQLAYVDFGLETIASTIQLRFGMGMFNAVTTVGATQQTSDLKLQDIGPYSP